MKECLENQGGQLKNIIFHTYNSCYIKLRKIFYFSVASSKKFVLILKTFRCILPHPVVWQFLRWVVTRCFENIKVPGSASGGIQVIRAHSRSRRSTGRLEGNGKQPWVNLRMLYLPPGYKIHHNHSRPTAKGPVFPYRFLAMVFW